MKTFLKIIGLFAWFCVILAIWDFDPLVASGISVLSIWMLLSQRIIDRLP